MPQTTDTVTVYQDEAGEWRWRRQADNGEIVATSGEGYTDKTHAGRMAFELNVSSTSRAIKFVVDEPEDAA
jgi:uncharacterized protein YegP (UPF0339 family)